MPIEYNCKKCKVLVSFPSTPNADTDKFEATVHAVYTQCANSGLCHSCGKKKK